MQLGQGLLLFDQSILRIFQNRGEEPIPPLPDQLHPLRHALLRVAPRPPQSKIVDLEMDHPTELRQPVRNAR